MPRVDRVEKKGRKTNKNRRKISELEIIFFPTDSITRSPLAAPPGSKRKAEVPRDESKWGKVEGGGGVE